MSDVKSPDRPKHEHRVRDKSEPLKTVLEMIDTDPEIQAMANRNVSFAKIMRHSKVRDRIIYNRNLRAKLAELSASNVEKEPTTR